MKKFLRKFAGFIYRMIIPAVEPIGFLLVIPRYGVFLIDLLKFYLKKDAPNFKLLDLHPILNDKTTLTGFDPQYFYQGVWAFEKVYKSKVVEHVDVGSQTNFVSFLTAVTQVKFVDIRPLEVKLDNFVSIKGSILDMPFSDNAINSLSCLHVAEHIGLGRYGDPIDPLGTIKACAELSRVLAPNGSLYFSLPIGKPRTCFNAHRVHSIDQILDYFKELELIELIVIDDHGKFIEHPGLHDYDNAIYSGGMFHFKKRISSVR
jgi:SAM-dependent methyltransferase